MDTKTKSPRINSIEWGKVTVEGNQTYKDVKLYPGGCREWDWKETGTHHRPGIQPADVEELLTHDAQVIVLSKGFNERLQVSQESIDYLNEKNITFYILDTEQAVQKYNEVRNQASAGALIHSTC